MVVSFEIALQNQNQLSLRCDQALDHSILVSRKAPHGQTDGNHLQCKGKRSTTHVFTLVHFQSRSSTFCMCPTGGHPSMHSNVKIQQTTKRLLQRMKLDHLKVVHKNETPTSCFMQAPQQSSAEFVYWTFPSTVPVRSVSSMTLHCCGVEQPSLMEEGCAHKKAWVGVVC